MNTFTFDTSIFYHYLCHFCDQFQDATLAKFVPTPNNGSPQLIRVHCQREDNTYFCIFQKLKFVWDSEKKTFRGLLFPNDLSYDHYVNSKGRKSSRKAFPWYVLHICCVLSSHRARDGTRPERDLQLVREQHRGHDYPRVPRAVQRKGHRSLLCVPSVLCRSVVSIHRQIK